MNYFAGIPAALLSIVHIVKMITETTQILCSALHLRAGGYSARAHMKLAYPKHPCVVWCARSRRNFHIARRSGIKYCRMYRRYYHKQRRHRCEAILKRMTDIPRRARGVPIAQYTRHDQPFGCLRHRSGNVKIPLRHSNLVRLPGD